MPRCRDPSTVKHACLSLTSPSILSRRLNSVVDHGLVLKKEDFWQAALCVFPHGAMQDTATHY